MTTNKTNITIDMLNTMSGQEFEELTADLFNKMGFSVQTTAITGDGGIDVKAINNEELTSGLYIIQCKRFTDNNVGIDEVQRLYGVAKAENAIKGVFVTTSNYTKKAEGFSETNNIELINGRKFVSLVNKYIKGTEHDKLKRNLTKKVKYPGKSGEEIIDEMKREIVFKKQITDPGELIKFSNECEFALSEVTKDMHKKNIYKDAANLKANLKRLKTIYKKMIEVNVNFSFYKKKPANRLDNLAETMAYEMVTDEINVTQLEKYYKTIINETEGFIKMVAEGIRQNLTGFSKYQDSTRLIEISRKSVAKKVREPEKKQPQKACYIATYCYGKNSTEYNILCWYRDNVLKRNILGRSFVQIYYKISPLLIRLFGKSNYFNLFAKKLISGLVDLVVYFEQENKT